MGHVFWKYPNILKILSQMELTDILWTIFTQAIAINL